MNGKTEAGEALFYWSMSYPPASEVSGDHCQVDCWCLCVMEAETEERFVAALRPGPGW